MTTEYVFEVFGFIFSAGLNIYSKTYKVVLDKIDKILKLTANFAYLLLSFSKLYLFKIANNTCMIFSRNNF